MPEQCRRRSPAAALMATTGRAFPGQPKHARNIKMGPTGSTDVTGGRNRAEIHSPAAEKKNCRSGRKWGNSKSALACTGEIKWGVGLAPERGEGAEGTLNREGGAPGYRLHQAPEMRQWRRWRVRRGELETRLRVLTRAAEKLKGAEGEDPGA